MKHKKITRTIKVAAFIKADQYVHVHVPTNQDPFLL